MCPESSPDCATEGTLELEAFPTSDEAAASMPLHLVAAFVGGTVLDAHLWQALGPRGVALSGGDHQMKSLRTIAQTIAREVANPAHTDLLGEVGSILVTPRTFVGLQQAGLIGAKGLDAPAFEMALKRELSAIRFEPPKALALAKVASEHAAKVVTFLEMPGAWPGKPASSTRLGWRKALGTLEPKERPPIRPIEIEASPVPASDVTVNGVRLRYIDAPATVAEKAVVLLIHGHSSCIEEHSGFLGALSETCRVLACDLPGCGYSDHPARGYTLKYYEDTLLAFADAMGLQKFAVAGGSLGGNLSLRLALRAPNRVTRAVSWAPANWLETNPALGMARALDESTFWFVLGQQVQTWFSDDNPDRERLIEGSLAYRREVYNPNFLQAYKDIAAEQVRTTMKPHAKDIRVPVKLMVGTDDHALGMVDGVRELKKLIPGAELAEFPGKHSIAEEHGPALVKEIHTFLGA